MGEINIKEHMFTIDEVAKALSVSRRTVERLIKKGELRAYQVGGQKRIPPVAVEQMLRQVELPHNYNEAWQPLDLF